MNAVNELDVEAHLLRVTHLLERNAIEGAMLRKEHDNLQITLETLRRIGGWSETDEAQTQQNGSRESDSAKPDGTPSVPAMILQVVSELQSRSGEGVEPKDVTAEIRRRWWPEVQSYNIGPRMWRMAVKEARLEKIAALYYLPKNEVSSVPADDTSKREGGVGNAALL